VQSHLKRPQPRVTAVRASVRSQRLYAPVKANDPLRSQGKTTAEELTRRVKEGAIPIISDVEGFRAYYVVYAPDDTVTAISVFNDCAGAEESNRRALSIRWRKSSACLSAPNDARKSKVF
jgi:hypothetical protein